MADAVKPGDTVRTRGAFGAKGFALKPNEQVGADFAAFSRDGRENKVLQVAPGSTLNVLTNPNDMGFLYARMEVNGSAYACQMLPGSYERA